MRKFLIGFLIAAWILPSICAAGFQKPLVSAKSVSEGTDNSSKGKSSNPASDAESGKASGIVDVHFKSALLMEESTGKILYEYEPHARLSPASVTKVMTLLLTLEDLAAGKIRLDDKVTVSARAHSIGGTTMCLQTGEIRSVEDLIKGIAMQSANDGAVAMAEFLGGSEENFVKRMNERAAELGMKDTHFVNPMGFYDKEHYSSAYDIAIMSRELLKHRQILNYSGKWMETISEGRKAPIDLVNTNKMLRGYTGCDGLKTGYIPESKYCISATAMRNQIRFIAVIMAAPTSKERNEAAGKLLSYGFASYENKSILKKNQKVGELVLRRGKPSSINVITSKDLNLILPKASKIKAEFRLELQQGLKPPMKEGTVVGKYIAYDGSGTLGEVPVVIDKQVLTSGLADSVKNTLKAWINLK